MARHTVTLIPGDGIGPELAEAARRVLDATGVEFDWDVQEAGVDVMAEARRHPLPDATSSTSIRGNEVALKGPITTPVGNRLPQRQRRPAPGARTCTPASGRARSTRACAAATQDVDLVIVRENTEDLYAGIEFEAGKPATAELIEYINELAGGRSRRPTTRASRSSRSASRAPSGSSASPSSTPAHNGRKKVTAVHKANIMKFTDGLFLARRRARWPRSTRTSSSRTASSTTCACSWCRSPELYDVLVLPNLYGDILSDLCAGPGRRAGRRPGREHRRPTARSSRPPTARAPKYKGLNKVNPTALILSGVLMLRHLERDRRGRPAGERPSPP